MTLRAPIPVLWAAAFCALLNTACTRSGDGAEPAAAASAPAVGVSTTVAQQRDLPVQLTATGTVVPLNSVEVRPQVSSVVQQVHVREGQLVRAGELLFTLDARVDQANLAQAQAQLARDQAGLADAQRQLARSRELLAQGFVSQGAVDTTQSLVDSQAAVISADRAAIDAARVALSYARIRATSAGRIGAITVYPGSSVQANVSTLVTVTQLDPMAVAFSLPQRHLADAVAALQSGGSPVTATLPDQAGAPLNGRLQFVDNAVDAGSGTVKVKAVFPNQEARLWPGAFVNVAMTVRTLRGVVVLPQAAILQTARGTIVYVAKDGKAELRQVEVLQAQGLDAAVTGVQAGEHIVLDGRQNLRPGAALVERPPQVSAEAPAQAPARAASATTP